MPRCPTCKRRLNSGAACPADGSLAPSSPERAGEPPAVVGDYVLGERLGGGGFAGVWAATRQLDGSRVAIKIGHVATTIARTRFAREADALARVGAPSVPVLHHHGVLPDGRPYLIMELLDEEPLSLKLGAMTELADGLWVRDVMDAVLSSLAAVHDNQLVHRDLTPDNIFFFGKTPPYARLVDFGITKAMGHSRRVNNAKLTRTGTVIGTIEYMAPEQFADDAVIDGRTDIYTIGVLLYELLTLHVPFVGDALSVEHGHLSLRPPRPSEMAPVPTAVERLCLACLAKDPAKRPPDVGSLRRQLRGAWMNAVPRAISDGGSSSRSVPLLSDAHQPVVVLVADVPEVSPDVRATIARRHGIIARQTGRRYIIGFTGLVEESPAEAALATARELVDRGAQVVLHLADLKLRQRASSRPPRLYGRAVEDPSTWLPRQVWSGLLLTPRAAAALSSAKTRASTAFMGFYELAPEMPDSPDVEPRLVGQDDLLLRAAASLDNVLSHKMPGLFTLYGESGLGKSRIAREIVAMARTRAPAAPTLHLQAASAALATPSETLYRLLDMAAEMTSAPAFLQNAVTESRTVVDDARLLGDSLRKRATHGPVILVLDDAHQADSATLDALEYATLDGDGIALWVAVIAHPKLERRRPKWGQRVYRHYRANLAPLSEAAAMELAVELLYPAEYPPAATLRRLAHWAGGNPHSLAALVRTLKQEGLIRKRPRSASWYLATAELDQLPSSPASQWLASRQLSGLRPELAACLRLCAVLGVQFLRDELEWVQNEAERSGTATTSLDTDVGLAELARRGFIAQVHLGVWHFPQAALQDAVYKNIGAEDRVHIHRAALAFWQSQRRSFNQERVLVAISRHAGASNAAADAADAHLTLGDRARTEHRDVDADQSYTAALPYLEPSDHRRRAWALAGRGEVRYRLQRSSEAIADLHAAQDHAIALRDLGLQARLLLEEATALDWAAQFTESAACVAQAQPIVERVAVPALVARYEMALGRSRFRQGNMLEAATLLERGAERAATHNDVQTAIVSSLVLGHALVYLERLDRAEHVFVEAIALCERTGDGLHLCACYINRVYLWSVRKSLPNITRDLRKGIKLARELGLPVIEHHAAHNLAEFLHWSGKHAEALPLAKRAHRLQRHLPAPMPLNARLLARVHAALNQPDEARRMLREVREQVPALPMSEGHMLVVELLEQVLGDAPLGVPVRSQDDIMMTARESLPVEDVLELLYFRARHEVDQRRWVAAQHTLTEAQSLLTAHQDPHMWQEPFSMIEQQVRRSG